MNKRSSTLYRWLDARLGLDRFIAILLDEPIPGGARWSYVFGSGLLFLFIIQLVTGIFLTMYYVPGAAVAHTSVSYIQKEITGGAFVRGLHHWGSTLLIVTIGVHMGQVFLWGAFKKPREMVWVFGMVLMLLILAFSFTGYLLPWDQKAYFATAVGVKLVSEVPIVGGFLKAVTLGGARLGTLTLSRFYMMHVIVLPALTVFFVGMHMFAFRRAGAEGPYAKPAKPIPNRIERFYPRQFYYDTVFSAGLFFVIAALAITEPVALEPRANPADAAYIPRPEWYFLPLFQLLKYFQGELAILGIVVIPGVLLALLFLVPFIDRKAERNPFRRRIAIGSMAVLLLTMGILLRQAKREDGALMSVAESQELLAMPEEEVAGLSGAERRRWEIAQTKMTLDRQRTMAEAFLARPFEPLRATAQPPSGSELLPPPGTFELCSECHGALGGGGTLKGPDIIGAADEYTRADLLGMLVDPVLYGFEGKMVPMTDVLTEAEREELVDYLVRLSEN